MEEVQQRSGPARPRRISDIRIGDERVRVVGTVVDKGEVEFTLDDGSGRLTVIFDDPSLAIGVEVGLRLRVFGSPLSVAGTNELHADIIQRVDRLDLSLYNEVRREAEKLDVALGR